MCQHFERLMYLRSRRKMKLSLRLRAILTHDETFKDEITCRTAKNKF